MQSGIKSFLYEIVCTMDVLLALPLPLEIIYCIASYDRALSVNPISRADDRYIMLLTVPPKQTTYYGVNELRGWYVKFTHPHHALSMVLADKYENIYTYINNVDDDRCEMYFWQ